MDTMFDPTGDLATVVDRLEPVTLQPRDGSPPTQIAGALRRSMSTAEAAASDGRYTASDVRWHLPVESVQTPPAVGDRIVDGSGATWTILSLRLATAESRWQCVARDLIVSSGLNERITIRREVATQDSSGAVERTWQDVLTNVVARIQENSAERNEQHGRQSGVVVAQVFVAEPVTVDNGYRIIAADGRVFEVTGFESSESIEQLMTIHALRRL